MSRDYNNVNTHEKACAFQFRYYHTIQNNSFSIKCITILYMYRVSLTQERKYLGVGDVIPSQEITAKFAGQLNPLTPLYLYCFTYVFAIDLILRRPISSF